MTAQPQSADRPPPSETFGVGCVVLGMLFVSLQDVMIKLLSGAFPLHEVVLTRAVIAGVILVMVARVLEGGPVRLRTPHWKLHVTRGLCIVTANMTFFLSIAVVPLAEATAVFFVAPLLITLMSVPFLREQVGWRRMSAVLVGFLGVVVIINPGSDFFDPAILLPLVAALAYATSQIIVRRIGVRDSASTMAFYIQAVFVVICIGVGLSVGDGRYADGSHPSLEFLLRAWKLPEGNEWWILLAVGLISGGFSFLISQAYRIASASLLAPFEYIALPMSMLWGFLFFDWTPDSRSLAGISLILASGLFIIYRQLGLKSKGR